MSEIALYKALVSAGAPEEEARAAVADLARAQDVATKADLAEMKADGQNVATKADIFELKSDLADLESRMVQMEARLIKWMAGVGLAILLALISVLLQLP